MEEKYRVWSKSTETMEKVLALEWNTNGDLTKVKTESGTYNANQVKLMRCIGEVDGQEVYEGDIIWDPWEEAYATIEWDEEDFGYDLNWDDRSYVESMCNRSSDLVVAGNIYQPPELSNEDTEECPEVLEEDSATTTYDELNHEFAINFVKRREYAKGVQFAMNVLANRFPHCCKHHMVGLDDRVLYY